MRAVIDTNCLIVSIPPQSPHYWLYKAFRDYKFEWLISNEVITEYNELLTSYYSNRTAELVLNLLGVASNVIYTEAYFKCNSGSEKKSESEHPNSQIIHGVACGQAFRSYYTRP